MSALDAAELRRFLDSYLYTEPAFLVDEVTRLDAERKVIEGRCDTTRALPVAPLQRVTPAHPAHVSGAELIMLTGNLGSLHAWCFHGCRWDEGWAGFGARIHKAEFRGLVRLGPPLLLTSTETRCRLSPDRLVLRYTFDFRQDDQQVYFGDQTAVFVRER